MFLQLRSVFLLPAVSVGRVLSKRRWATSDKVFEGKVYCDECPRQGLGYDEPEHDGECGGYSFSHTPCKSEKLARLVIVFFKYDLKGDLLTVVQQPQVPNLKAIGHI